MDAEPAVAIRLGFVLFLEADPHSLVDHCGRCFAHFCASPTGARLSRFRVGGEIDWDALPSRRDRTETWFASTIGPAPGTWLWEAADQPADDAPLRLQFTAVEAVFARRRASMMRVLLPDDTPASELAALATWSIDNMPLWWGTAGWMFETQPDLHPQTIGDETAALAKRYWSVQILDPATLQQDALRGLPGVNWLTLVGTAFAAEHACELAVLAEQASGSVFLRRGVNGLALAAGPRPLLGDINIAEDFSGYVALGRLLAPLLLKAPTPLGGFLADQDVLLAWIERFSAPAGWLAARLERTPADAELADDA